MPLPIPTHIPPVGPQTDPTQVNVAVVVGGQLASAPARGIGLTAEELAALDAGGLGDNISTAADMSIGFRTTPGNRFVVNDKADMTGTDVMTVTEGGVVSSGPVIASGFVTSSQNFLSSTTQVLLAPSAAGTVFLRPNGSGSPTGQTTIDSAGNLTAATSLIATIGSISSGNGAVLGSGNYIQLGPTTAGTVYLRPQGAYSPTNQTTIDSAGNMTIAASLTAATGNISSGTYSTTGATAGIRVLGPSGITDSSVTVTTSVPQHRFNNPNGQVGSISTNASATAYTTSSDELLKDFIGPLDPLAAIEIIRADPVRAFTWKVDGSYAVGWGAQTSYNVSQDLATPPPPRSPEEIAIEGAGTDPKEPGYNPWGMDQSKRTPYLWAALSHALDKIDELEARLAALEAQ